jgi:hypothetical protein
LSSLAATVTLPARAVASKAASSEIDGRKRLAGSMVIPNPNELVRKYCYFRSRSGCKDAILRTVGMTHAYSNVSNRQRDIVVGAE